MKKHNFFKFNIYFFFFNVYVKITNEQKSKVYQLQILREINFFFRQSTFKKLRVLFVFEKCMTLYIQICHAVNAQ